MLHSGLPEVCFSGRGERKKFLVVVPSLHTVQPYSNCDCLSQKIWFLIANTGVSGFQNIMQGREWCLFSFESDTLCGTMCTIYRMLYFTLSKHKHNSPEPEPLWTWIPDHFLSLAQRMLLHCPRASCVDPLALHWSPYPPERQRTGVKDRNGQSQSISRFATKAVAVFLNLPTTFSLDRRTPILPKRTWKGEHCRDPSGCLTTMTSMQPERVAGLSPRYNSLTWTNTWPASWPT